MDTNKMRDLKALAEAATQSHGARRVEVDHNGVHVIGDGSWKILSAWHTPDGKGAQNAEFAAAASPATVLALLAEIDRLATSRSKKERDLEQELEVWHRGPFCWTCGDTGDVHDITGEWRGECDCLSAQLINANRERDQLKAENKALRTDNEAWRLTVEAERQIKDATVASLSGEIDRMGGAGFADELAALRKDAERYRWLRDGAGYCDARDIPGMAPARMDAFIDAAMAKEASHG